MRSSRERILTTHAGSLPRSPALMKLYLDRARGKPIDEAALSEAGRTATRDVVQQQVEAGIDVGNNGEQQREGFFLYIQHRMTGFGGSWKRWPRGDVENYPVYKRQLAESAATRPAMNSFGPPKAIGEILYKDVAAAEIEPVAFQDALSGAGNGFVEGFLTAPSPGIIAAAMKNEYYATEEAYLGALSEALRVEYEVIVKHGFILQLDCPDLALERHMSFYERDERVFLEFCERVVAAINNALRNIPRDRVRMHVCWGNYEGPHDLDVPLETIWPILRQANVGAFVLPFANPRHAHEIDLMRTDPPADDQVIVAGVIDSLTNFVEHPENVADRIQRVARALDDPTRVLAGTDCGFDTSAGSGRVASDIVWAKLRSMSEGAKLASERLF